jgi:Cu(I)/Ag(I) efflux system membrane fusion protein
MQYACPMKCEGEKTYPAPGKCPVCGMNLKEAKAGDDGEKEK